MTLVECPYCQGQGTVPLDGVDVKDCKHCGADGMIETGPVSIATFDEMVNKK